MLTHTRNKNGEKIKEDKKHARNFLSSSFCEEKISAKFCSQVDTKSPKKRRENSEVFFPFLTFHHPSLCFLSFFLSFSAATKPEFFLLFARAKTERERLREAFEKAFFDYSFYLYECIKGRRRWKFFFNDPPHF